MKPKSGEEYQKLVDKYDQLGAQLEDAIENKEDDERDRLKKEMDEVEGQINAYERGGQNNEAMSFNKIKRYSYYKGYKKLKNKLKLFEEFIAPVEEPMPMTGDAPEEERLEETERKLSDIAAEISADWKNVNPAAAPYLDAMHSCDTIDGNYGADSCASVVAYFLSNASRWTGPKAKEIKKELNAMLKKYYAK